MAEPDPLPVHIDHVRRAFGLGSVALVQRADGGWRVEAQVGDLAPTSPGDADLLRPVGDGLVLAVRGSDFADDDQRVFNAFAAQLAPAIERRRLADSAA